MVIGVDSPMDEVQYGTNLTHQIFQNNPIIIFVKQNNSNNKRKMKKANNLLHVLRKTFSSKNTFK